MKEISTALVAFQAEMPTVHKSKTAKVGSYSYTYADLADVTREAMPRLTTHGLAFTCQSKRCDDGTYELLGVLTHTSGETFTGALPIHGRTPQELGSSLTYARRYLLGCLTGIVTDDDDDAGIAQSAERTKRQPKPENPFEATRTMSRAKKSAPEPEPETGNGTLPIDAETMTDKQRSMLMPLFLQAGIRNQTNRHDYAQNIIGRPIKSSNEMTKAEASRVIDALLQDVRDMPPEEPPEEGRV